MVRHHVDLPVALDDVVGEVDVVDEVRRARERVVVRLGAGDHVLDAGGHGRAPLTIHTPRRPGRSSFARS